jgi:hypothetical protein
MANLVLLDKVTVGSGGTSSITFSSIPQTYTDLVVEISLRCNRSTVREVLMMRLNGATSNYSLSRLYGDSTSVGADTVSGETGMIVGDIVGDSATSNTFGNGAIYIPNYAGSTYKSLSADLITENAATEASQYFVGGLWSDTSAINSITLYCRNSFNFNQYSTAYLYGVSSAAVGAKATGGNIISQDANYYYHIFTSSGTFTPLQSLTADYLVVAGGGGASANAQAGGGGGAGGLRSTVTATGGGGSLETALSLTAQAYTVTIGAGGAGGSSQGSNGSNSVFSTITSTGGGAGGFGTNTANAINGFSGGSGGGGSSTNQTSTSTGGAGTSNQGYAGGGGRGDSSGVNKAAGGGGGAGAAGGTQNSAGVGGAGGIGVATSISGTLTYYAGGGGGAGQNSGGAGGLGGGATGGGGNSSVSAAGTANTGGGAATAYKDNGAFPDSGAAGGSGIVIVRYAK